MRVLWIFLSLASLLQAADLDYLKSYRAGGIRAVEEKLQEALMSREVWRQNLESLDTRFGYYEDLPYLFVAEKSTLEVTLYEGSQGEWKLKYSAKTLMGSAPGDKKIQDDLRTPIGVYDLTSKLTRATKLDSFYGPLALVTSYPNLYDRLEKKTGYGIWIHGMPLNGDRDINTRGCIAFENQLLESIDSSIDYRKTLLITADKNMPVFTKDDLAVILSDLFKWKKAWTESDADGYLGFYSKERFQRFDGMRFGAFSESKRRVFARKETKTILFDNLNIAPYPNERGEKFFRVTFFETYRSPSYSFSGNKELYVAIKDGRMEIVIER